MGNNDRYIGLTDDRLRHMREVARLLVDLADIAKITYTVPRDAIFLIGLLHDVGYEYSLEQAHHPKIGADMVKHLNPMLAHYVGLHGDPRIKQNEPILALLNIADLATGPAGEHLTIEARLANIARRYGEHSQQHTDAAELYAQIDGWAKCWCEMGAQELVDAARNRSATC